MLLPKGTGMTWKSARARLPPSRAIWNFLTRTRFLLFVAIAGIIILIWNGVRGSAGDFQKYVQDWTRPERRGYVMEVMEVVVDEVVTGQDMGAR